MDRVEPGVAWTDPDPDEQTVALARRNHPAAAMTPQTIDRADFDELVAKVDAVRDGQANVEAKVDGLSDRVEGLADASQPATVAEAVAQFLGKAPK